LQVHVIANAFVATWGISFNETSNITHNALLMNKKGKEVFISHYSNYTSFTFATNCERVHKNNKVNT
jgi:hypothetical protein